MVKPLNQFGGWLRFFQVIAALNFLLAILTVISALLLLAGLVTLPNTSQEEVIIALIIAVPFAIVMSRIVRTLRLQDTDTPARIARMAWIAIGLALLERAMAISAAMSADPELTFFEAFSWPHGITWLLVLTLYLQMSKRVKAFYGVNFRENTDPYIKDPIEDMFDGWRNRPGQDK